MVTIHRDVKTKSSDQFFCGVDMLNMAIPVKGNAFAQLGSDCIEFCSRVVSSRAGSMFFMIVNGYAYVMMVAKKHHRRLLHIFQSIISATKNTKIVSAMLA